VTGAPDLVAVFSVLHEIWWLYSLYCTVQFKCVQTAENARHSASVVRTNSTGRLPNFTILPLFGLRSSTLPAGGLVHGGLRNIRRVHELKGRIEKRNNRGRDTAAQEGGHQVTAWLHYWSRSGATEMPKSKPSRPPFKTLGHPLRKVLWLRLDESVFRRLEAYEPPKAEEIMRNPQCERALLQEPTTGLGVVIRDLSPQAFPCVFCPGQGE
jgi:hypothetical protein